MKGKRFLALVLTVLMLSVLVVGCQGETPTTTPGGAAPPSSAAPSSAPPSSAAPSQSVPPPPPEKEFIKNFSLYGEGSDNVRVQFEQQVELFNATNEHGYVATLQWMTSGTGTISMHDRMIGAFNAGESGTDFDVFEFGGDNIPNYMSRGGPGMFHDLDYSLIPNAQYLQFEANEYPEKFIPYRGTTVVLAYNSAVISNPPKTADELYQWIKDNPGRFAYNPPSTGGAGSAFVRTVLYNDLPPEALLSIDEKWMDEWEPGWDKLRELHPYLYKSGGKVVYPNKNQGSIDLLAAGEVDMIPAWADMIISQRRSGTLPDSIQIVQIEPAFTGSTVVLCVPTMGTNYEGAHAFINYMLSPEAQNIALDSMAAIPVIDFNLLDKDLLPLISSLKINEFRLSTIGILGNHINEIFDEEIAPLG